MPTPRPLLLLTLLIVSPACGSGPADCGPVAAPFVCEPDDDGGLITLICAARDQDHCNGIIDLQTGGECRWEQTLSYAHDAVSCEEPKIGGACIAFIYSGDSICEHSACGGDMQDAIYYRTDDSCKTQVFRHTRCGERLVDWNPCTWDTPATDGCPLPDPSAGPALCNCACEAATRE